MPEIKPPKAVPVRGFWGAAKKAGLEVIRLATFAAPGVLVTELTQLPVTDQTEVVLIATMILRFVDKWIHENDKVKASGLLPF